MSRLLLTRRPNEEIIINTGSEVIKIRVTRIDGKQARLAFDANSNVQIDRAELYERKMAQRMDKDG